MQLTQEEAEVELREWQKVLRLQDWDINVQIVDDLEGSLGSVDHSYKYKSAKIRLLSKESIEKGSFLGSTCMKENLAHEIVHLHFSGIDSSIKPESHNFYVFENGIEFTAQALVNLKRRAEAAEQRVKELEGKT